MSEAGSGPSGHLKPNNWFNFSKPIYNIGLCYLYCPGNFFCLLLYFNYLNPLEVSDNMKAGRFHSSIRPGKPTSDYLDKILNYIILSVLSGFVIIAIIPFFFNGVFGASVSFWRNIDNHHCRRYP